MKRQARCCVFRVFILKIFLLMSLSVKYGRTYHYPFSPGTTSDDRIQYDYWDYLRAMSLVVHTEKLDGENNCLSRLGVFARSHAAPTTSPWTGELRRRWEILRHDLGELELFGENLYAIHSIRYERLEHHFYVFAIRVGTEWLSWEEVQFYAAAFDFPTVPVLGIGQVPEDEPVFRKQILAWAAEESPLGSVEAATGAPCTREGIVTRNAAGFSAGDFAGNVFKYVRKGHVTTDAHWTRNWQRAPLLWELSDPPKK